MKTEGWGNGADGQFQGLKASKFLPQLTQDELLLHVRHAENPQRYASVRLGNSIRSSATEIHFLTPMNTRERG
jgi:hypothetical protein